MPLSDERLAEIRLRRMARNKYHANKDRDLLLDEVDRLRSALEGEQAITDQQILRAENSAAEVDHLRAENEQLWAQVAAVEALMPKWEAEINDLTRAKEFGIAEAFRSAQGDLRAALDSSAEVRDA